MSLRELFIGVADSRSTFTYGNENNLPLLLLSYKVQKQLYGETTW
jgi:hypothetical protein